MWCKKLFVSIFILPFVFVVHAGATPSPDFNSNGVVDIPDFLMFLDNFGLRQGDPGFDSRFDLDGDGIIGVGDFTIFADNFGKEVGRTPQIGPTWVFAGDIPEGEKTELKEEMEDVRSWFYERYGVLADDFTVLVGTSSDVLDPIAREAANFDLAGTVAPPGYQGPGSELPTPFVATVNGTTAMVLIYERNPFSSLKNAIAHEYFHILQIELSQDPSEEIEPYWLVEGSALYADHAYSLTKATRRPFLGDRYTPYEDVSIAINLQEAMKVDELTRLADFLSFRGSCDPNPIYTYALSFLGLVFIVEQTNEEAYVKYWKLLGENQTQENAFKIAFGMDLDDFYKRFEAWLPSQLQTYISIGVKVHWPLKGMTERDIIRFNWLLNVEPVLIEFHRQGQMSWGSFSHGVHTIITSSENRWTCYLSLWIKEGDCTEHLLGWYKNGVLVKDRSEATIIEFTGEPFKLDWPLPDIPDRLPRLEKRTLSHCN